MEKIAVGKPYSGHYRQEGIKFAYNGGFNLNIFLKNLKANEIQDIKKGDYTFGLTVLEGIMFFTCSFGDAIETSNIPFHFGLYTDDRIKNLPTEIAEGQGLALNITAVDAHTGIVKALRLIGLSTEFSRKLIEVCHDQSSVEVNRSEYDKQLQHIQTMYSSKDIYGISSVKCSGGH